MARNWLLGLACAAACGRSVAEPDPAPRASDLGPKRDRTAASTSPSASAAPGPRLQASAAPGSSATASSAASSASPASPASAASSTKPEAGSVTPSSHCIFPTPAEPTRPAPPKGPAPGCPAEPTPPPKLRHATVRIAGRDATVDVEVAERDLDRQRGLMWRTALAESAGMLFVFEAEKDLAFWMKNTCLPLDMLFMAGDGVVVGIEENVPTLNEDNYQPGDCKARYVLEVNAGWARRHGVKAGDRAIFGGLS